MSHIVELSLPLGSDDRPFSRTSLSIGPGVLQQPSEPVREWLAGRTVFFVSSEPIRALHGERLAALEAAAGHVVHLDVVDGEAAKSLDQAGTLWQEMLRAGGKRDSRLVAFGGGSVGDLGGFVAGCFLRGIEVLQAPTTLLAQVDAAIGGKTAIDLPEGKNTVGLFHHPRFVLSDTEVLGTLPPGELRSGLVEAIKKAALLDPALFERIESNLDSLLAGDIAALGPVVAAAAAAKCHVVERDPTEGDFRRVLNFGHTLGHGIEGALNYRTLRHGEAVAYGLLFAQRLAETVEADGGAPEMAPETASGSSAMASLRDFGDRLRALVHRLDLPDLPLGPEDADELWGYMARDKKATEAGLAWVLPRGLGAHRFTRDLERERVLDTLRCFLAEPHATGPFQKITAC